MICPPSTFQAACCLALALSVPTAAGEALFEDITSATDLDFVHVNGMSGQLYFAEMMGAGGALIDFDRDGDLDLFLVQGHALVEGDTPVANKLPDRFYRNDADRGSPPRYVDVTAQMGIASAGYGMGVATGDINNDGHTDLYVANFGRNQLLLADGQGGFRDATSAAGVDDPRWSVAATFFDYDGDGWLDLFVANYVNFSMSNVRPCFNAAAVREYCGPTAHPPEPDRLFRNRGDGTFKDVTRSAGLGKARGAALGAVAADFNGDGLADLYVANDAMANDLWLNQGDGRFVDDALFAGVAVNMEGAPEASMGVEAEDFDNDGDVDLFITHLARETNTLYVNDGKGFFDDRTVGLGLANASFRYTGFGVGWRDFDNDGRRDLFIANGAVLRIAAQVRSGDKLPLKEPNLLFLGVDGGGYRGVDPGQAGEHLSAMEVTRGALFGDLDDDGDIDMVLTNNNGPARVLENRASGGRPWLGLRLLTSKNGRHALGARVTLDGAAGARRVARSHTDGSYVSASDPRILLALPGRSAVDIEVAWPGGEIETFEGLEPGRYHTLWPDGKEDE